MPVFLARLSFLTGIAGFGAVAALSLLLLSCDSRSSPYPPARLTGSNTDVAWEVAEPETAGFDSKALKMVVRNAELPGRRLHAVLVERHGRLVAERYLAGSDRPIARLYGIGLPFTPDTVFGPDVLHDARSISKSVLSLLLGTFPREWRSMHLDGPAATFFPDLKLAQDDKRRTITVRNLLTMSSGLDWNENAVPNDETRLFWKADIAGYVLGRPLLAMPGTRFLYNSGGAALLAQILVETGGEPLTDQVRERLFEPMGITTWEWTRDIYGRPLAFTGLRLLPRDMLKLGHLVLRGGMWHGRQIVSRDWVEASLGNAIGTGHKIPPGTDGELTYGYFWWSGFVSVGSTSFRWAAAFGNGGQRIYVVPALDISVVITAGSYGSDAVIPEVQALFQRILATVMPERYSGGEP
jgi:CubicO group peptidase (beta-lactamase class C family)